MVHHVFISYSSRDKPVADASGATTLVDAEGRRSRPLSFSFSFEVEKTSQAQNPASSFEIQAPNGMRFKVPR